MVYRPTCMQCMVFTSIGAPAFAAPIAQLFNRSLITSTVPQQASHHITRIPKVPTPPCHHNLIRPYPLLQSYGELWSYGKAHCQNIHLSIYPSLLQPPTDLNFHDQFAFRPTTAELPSWPCLSNHKWHVDPYVRLFCLDFSKAFDTVRHSTLLEKLAKLNHAAI